MLDKKKLKKVLAQMGIPKVETTIKEKFNYEKNNLKISSTNLGILLKTAKEN